MRRPSSVSIAIPSRHRLVRLSVAAAAVLSLVISLGTAYGAVRWVQIRDLNTDDTFETALPSGSSALPTGKCADDPCNYLLLGSDSRANLSEQEQEQFGNNKDIGGSNRADTIMLVHTDPNLQKAIILSFPRDLWVDIPGLGMDRINAAFEGGVEGGGPQLMAQTIANLTGLPIDHYLYVDLAGFQHIVDTLGGVTLCVPPYNADPATGRIQDPLTGLDIAPGCQRLDGFQALAYVRTRHLRCDFTSDFDRIGRQQQFLRAVINQMLRPQEIAKAPTLVGPVLENMRRDSRLLPGDLVYLVGQLRGITTGAAEFRAVPGTFGFEGSKAIVHMDPSAREIFAAIRKGTPISDVGTTLLNTPPSEANITVAVIDDGSQGAADVVERTLRDAGFDVTPGVLDASQTPRGVSGTIVIAYQPGHDAEAQVVSKYFAGAKVVESSQLTGAPVAIVVTSNYTPPSGGSSQPPTGSAAECPVANP
jgi:LCP family protein required for cell wall assembly